MPGFGGVAEWSIAPVLKTGNGQPFVSSNLTASASVHMAGQRPDEGRCLVRHRDALASFAFRRIHGSTCFRSP